MISEALAPYPDRYQIDYKAISRGSLDYSDTPFVLKVLMELAQAEAERDSLKQQLAEFRKKALAEVAKLSEDWFHGEFIYSIRLLAKEK